MDLYTILVMGLAIVSVLGLVAYYTHDDPVLVRALAQVAPIRRESWYYEVKLQGTVYRSRAGVQWLSEQGQEPDPDVSLILSRRLRARDLFPN